MVTRRFELPSTGTETALRDVALVTHGIDLNKPEVGGNLEAKKDFFKALIHFQAHQARNSKRTVSRQAVRQWEHGAVPRRLVAMDFLHDYLMWFRTKKEAQNWDQARLDLFAKAEAMLRATRNLDDQSEAPHMPSRLAPLDPLVSLVIQGLMNVSNRSEHTEASAFFRGSRSDQENDQSYYLMYRYSTNSGSVLKSFLVIQKPIREVRNVHIFNHFVWGGSTPPYLTHIFRECEGFIIKLAKAFYLLGYDYTVPVDKRRQPELYRRERPAAKWSPNGMGLITIEYDDVHKSPGLFGGLTLTVAAMSQPIVARIVLLHLGTRQELGREIFDHEVGPTEIPAGLIAEDLVKTIKHLRQLGCRRFGMVVDEYLHRDELDQNAMQDLSALIIKMIDNLPAWEARHPTENGRFAKGAIETFGDARPRD